MDEKIKQIEGRLQNPIFSKEPGRHLQFEQTRDDMRFLLSKIRELEELTANIGSDKALSEVLYEYHERADKAEAKVRELEDNIPDPAWCCEKHKAMLVNRIKELEEGIRTFDNEAYGEHCLAKTNSNCLTKLLRLVEEK